MKIDFHTIEIIFPIGTREGDIEFTARSENEPFSFSFRITPAKAEGLAKEILKITELGKRIKEDQDREKGNYFCLDTKCGWKATQESRPLSRGIQVGCPVCNGLAIYR
jgi:hypothetical protein